MDYENSFVIYDSSDQQVLGKKILKELGLDDKKFPIKSILSHISNAKNHLMTPEEYKMQAHNFFTEKVAQVYEQYQRRLKQSNALDFDDLLMKTVQLFTAQPELLAQYQDRFKYICVDEYQDTNQAQYKLVHMLAKKHKNLCVIGDNDQSIYSWRGADMQNILDFEKDYPDATVILLEQNYRSTKTILEAAHHIIKHNTKRKEKKLWTDNEDGAPISIYEAHHERDEAYYVVEQIKRELHNNSDTDYKNFAVLYRTNAQSRVLEESFMRSGIPYRIIGGIKFYERKEIKDMLAYLKVIHNPADEVSLLRIINTPTRGIGAKTISEIQEVARLEGTTLYGVINEVDRYESISNRSKKHLRSFGEMIEKLRKISIENRASAVIKHVIEETNYKKYLLEEGTDIGESRIENISELISVATKYDALEPGVSLAVFLEEVALIADTDRIDATDNSVVLMTVHSAKGLEFPHVFVIGLEEGIFPHSRSLLDPEQFEEERRLMYVAITRAEEVLHLTHARQRMLYGDIKANNASPFLLDLPPEVCGLPAAERIHGSVQIPVEGETGYVSDEEAFSNNVTPQLQAGDKIMHAQWGEGRVISLVGGVVTIAFADPRVAVRKLALSVAPIKKI
jgi:DNA helicase-2/ATP-dependent DNA helicase PcrA